MARMESEGRLDSGCGVCMFQDGARRGGEQDFSGETGGHRVKPEQIPPMRKGASQHATLLRSRILDAWLLNHAFLDLKKVNARS